jgi:hypothetical protein
LRRPERVSRGGNRRRRNTTWNDVKAVLDRAKPEQLARPVAVWEGARNSEGYWDASGRKLEAQEFGEAHEVHESGHTYDMDDLGLVVR